MINLLVGRAWKREGGIQEHTKKNPPLAFDQLTMEAIPVKREYTFVAGDHVPSWVGPTWGDEDTRSPLKYVFRGL